MSRTTRIAGVVLACTFVAGCAATPPDVTGAGSQLQTRQMQTREYDSLDRAKTLRSVIATLQDLGFVIDTADIDLGTVTATREDKYTMRMTVTVREKDAARILVRANARIGEDTVTDPLTYQDFFVALDKAMFLTRERVD